ncbi:hypothetical protein F3Y22_tig00012370pilonHSYRG00088 [Hibiscus syriacus]|uniref:Transcription factor MYC/MYB N-terminal domain-containing protein n=1 Tax=Hibiscus syriacus TaxID=106335 RepID=A0A6A3C3G1_HIBSY|nr:hypothetical protein F3Y22_tig00012370pilonHSYRG00088 [Hibiscus syriacus]
MVGSGSADRSKDAVGMMALHEALRTVCLNSDWTYSVFWTIRPRPRVRGGNGCKVGDDNGSLMLMWEDGFCKGRIADCLEEIDGEDPVRKAFSKMSIQLYNYGEGLMGKVASDKCHKWVFKEPTECIPLNLLDTNLVSICLSLFSSNRNASSLSTIPSKQSVVPTQPPPPLFNWSQRPLPTATNPMLASPNFQNPARLGFQQPKDETHMFLMPRSSETRMEDMIAEHENDIKWPNGLSFFSALTGRTEDAKLLFNSEGLGNKPETNHHPLILEGKDSNQNSDAGANPNEFLSLDSPPENMRK